MDGCTDLAVPSGQFKEIDHRSNPIAFRRVKCPDGTPGCSANEIPALKDWATNETSRWDGHRGNAPISGGIHQSRRDATMVAGGDASERQANEQTTGYRPIVRKIPEGRHNR